MSIKGFSVGGNVERYDYNSLDNLPSEITIDPALSGSSTNPVQNKVVTGAINATTDSVNALSGEVSGLKSAFENKIGDVLKRRTFIDVSSGIENGNVYGSIGSVVTIGTQTYWSHVVVDVVWGDMYEFVTNRTAPALTAYCVFTNSEDIVVGNEVSSDVNDDWYETNSVIVPHGATKMYINAFASAKNTTAGLQLYKVNYVDLQSQLNTVSENVYEEIDISASIVNGIVTGTVGTTPAIGSQPYWTHVYMDVQGLELLKVITNVSSPNTQGYAYAVNSSGKIIQRLILPDTTAEWTEHQVIIPGSATGIYIVAFANVTNASKFLKVYKISQVTANEKIARLENRVFYTGLPSYYSENDWFVNKLKEIDEKSAIKNGAVFAFFTDIHLPANAKNSKFLLSGILKRTTVPLVICGGDIVGAYGTEQDAKDQAIEWIEYCAEIDWDKVLQIQGNHDYTIKTSADEDTGWTASEKAIYNYVMRKQEKRVFCPAGKRYWYYDLPGNLRIIGFCGYERTNSGNIPYGVIPYQEKAEYDWLMNVAMPANGYKFIVITHSSPDRSGNIPASGGAACLFAMLNAMNNKTTFSQLDGSGDYTISGDYTNATSEIICVISGHNHQDASDDSNGVLYITTTSDACYNDDPHVTRQRGTVSEQAIDVFCVDTDARTINTVRVGGGNNRSWNY